MTHMAGHGGGAGGPHGARATPTLSPRSGSEVRVLLFNATGDRDTAALLKLLLVRFCGGGGGCQWAQMLGFSACAGTCFAVSAWSHEVELMPCAVCLSVHPAVPGCIPPQCPPPRGLAALDTGGSSDVGQVLVGIPWVGPEGCHSTDPPSPHSPATLTTLSSAPTSRRCRWPATRVSAREPGSSPAPPSLTPSWSHLIPDPHPHLSQTSKTSM